MISKEEYEMLISKGNACLDINCYEKACFYFNKAADNYSGPAEAHFGLMFAVSYNHPRHLVGVCERYCRELFGCWAANKMNAHFNLAKRHCKKGSTLEKTLNRMDYLVETFLELSFTYDSVAGTCTSNYKKFLKIKDDFEKITDKDVRNSELFKNLQFMWEFERPTVEWRYNKQQRDKLIKQIDKKDSKALFPNVRGMNIDYISPSSLFDELYESALSLSTKTFSKEETNFIIKKQEEAVDLLINNRPTTTIGEHNVSRYSFWFETKERIEKAVSIRKVLEKHHSCKVGTMNDVINIFEENKKRVLERTKNGLCPYCGGRYKGFSKKRCFVCDKERISLF